MLWFVIALQAMTPFIHAHAGAVRLSHADLPHGHQGEHGDAAYHAVVNGEHGAAVEVAQGMPARPVATAGADAVVPFVARDAPPAATASGLRADLPNPTPLQLSPPDHTLPLALAPPLR